MWILWFCSRGTCCLFVHLTWEEARSVSPLMPDKWRKVNGWVFRECDSFRFTLSEWVALWVCISLNSLGPISDRACYRLIHRYIQDAGSFCFSNAKHLASEHCSHASSGKDQVSSKNKMRQRSDKIRNWRGHFQVSDKITKWLEKII